MFNIVEYISYRLYSFLARTLPLKSAYKLADCVGYLITRVKSLENKERAYIMQKLYSGEISINSAYRMVCRSLQLFNRDLVDFFRSHRLNRNNIDLYAEIEGLEYMDEALGKGKGVILASAHMGSWEMSGIVLAVKGYPIYGMVWEAGNKMVADLLGKVRSKKGVGAVKSSALRQAFELLHKNNIIGIMLDVDGGSKGIPYNLLGYNVRLPRAPAAISRASGSELLVGIMVEKENRGYKFHIEKPPVTGDETRDTITLFEMAKKYMEKYPVQWHWIKYLFYPLS